MVSKSEVLLHIEITKTLKNVPFQITFKLARRTGSLLYFMYVFVALIRNHPNLAKIKASEKPQFNMGREDLFHLRG